VRYRSDAKEQDIIFVTGTLGDSAAGLHILLNDLSVIDQSYFKMRHQMPEPRVSFVDRLQSIKRMALIYITDGIANELREIAIASDKNMIVYDKMIPVHTSFKQFDQKQQYQWKYFGGEDFELVGTVAEKDWPILKEASQQIGLRVTKIGNVALKQSE